MTSEQIGNVTLALRKQAAQQVAQYPQYAGRFDAMVIARAKRDVRTKAGLAMKKGEVVLVEAGVFGNGEFTTIWSMRNKVHTSVRTRDLVLV